MTTLEQEQVKISRIVRLSDDTVAIILGDDIIETIIDEEHWNNGDE